MSLDTRPLLEALDPPVLIHEGVEYRGRHLSLLEWMRWMTRLEDYGRRRLSLFQQQRLHRDLIDAWFPPPRVSWWARLRGRRPEEVRVSDLVLALPLVVQDKLIAGFIDSQRRTMVADARERM